MFNIFHIVCLILVAIFGAIFVYYNKHKRGIRYYRIECKLLENPSNGVPSKFFLDAFERKFHEYQIEECIECIKILDGEQIVAFISCHDGIISSKIYLYQIKFDNIYVFLEKINCKPEFWAVKQLMNMGCFGMKM